MVQSDLMEESNPQTQNLAPDIIELHLSHVVSAQRALDEGGASNEPQQASENRQWRVKIKLNGQPADKHSDGILLNDPCHEAQYDRFQFYVDKSYELSRETIELAKELQIQLTSAKHFTKTYAKKLLHALGLEHLSKSGHRKLIIVEDHNSSPQHRSGHTLAWELLEDKQYWETPTESIGITRAICQQGCSPEVEIRENVLFRRKQPVRMLLIIGRDVTNSTEPFKDPEVSSALIQRPLMQVIQHLETYQHEFCIDLEVITPASMSDLEAILEERQPDLSITEPYYDIIHVDMHGKKKQLAVNSQRYHVPAFTFTNFDGRTMDDKAEEVERMAKVLGRRTKMLVINACNHGGFGHSFAVDMARHFVLRNVDAVCATSFRLLSTAAAIFYPSFYMSLFMQHSFDHAAASARQALRDNTKRRREKNGDPGTREDHFIHWNWFSRRRLDAVRTPSPSMEWQTKACIVQTLSQIRRAVCWLPGMSQFVPPEENSDYSLFNNFSNLRSHVTLATQLDIPAFENAALSIEHWLRKTSNRNSVYLRPTYAFRKYLPDIERLADNMSTIWLRTGFVDVIKVVNLHYLKEQPDSRETLESLFGTGRKPLALTRSGSCKGYKRSPIRKIMIIKNFDLLSPAILGEEGYKHVTLPRQEAAYRGLVDTAEEMDIGGLGPTNGHPHENFYLLTIGIRTANGLRDRPMIRSSMLDARFLVAHDLSFDLRERITRATCRRKMDQSGV